MVGSDRLEFLHCHSPRASPTLRPRWSMDDDGGFGAVCERGGVQPRINWTKLPLASTSPSAVE